jgi:hypothetical protein
LKVLIAHQLYGLFPEFLRVWADLLQPGKSDPVSLDTVWTTMTAAKETRHEGQGAKAHHDSWQ